MEIIYLREVDSTQSYLKSKLKSKELKTPILVTAKNQTAGVGSRGNSWVGLDGNLFFSFAIEQSFLPKDLKLESSSIYFGYLLKLALFELGSKVWLKWANDLYIDKKKIGGVLTSKVGDILICGVGINLKNSPCEFKILDISISKEEILEKFITKLYQKINWKSIFTLYSKEFVLSKNMGVTNNNSKVSLKDAKLNFDGSIELNGEIIYSFR